MKGTQLALCCFVLLVFSSMTSPAHGKGARNSKLHTAFQNGKISPIENDILVKAFGEEQLIAVSQDKDKVIITTQDNKDTTLDYDDISDDAKQLLATIFWNNITTLIYRHKTSSAYTYSCADLNAQMKEPSLTLKIHVSQGHASGAALDKYCPFVPEFITRTSLSVSPPNLPQGSFVTIAGSAFFEPGTCSECSGSGEKRCLACKGKGYVGISVHKTIVGRSPTGIPAISESRTKNVCSVCRGEGVLRCTHDDDFPTWKPSKGTVKNIPGNSFAYCDYIEQKEYKRIYLCLKNMQIAYHLENGDKIPINGGRRDP